jgi:hypothetical protein
VLALPGIKPAADAQVNVNLEFRAGYVIDLSGRDNRAERAKIVDSAAGEAVDATPVD